MIITYQGVEFFKVQYGDVVVALNPISKASKLKGARFGADIAVTSANLSDFNGADAVSLGDKKPFVISGPGEYEYKEVNIRGLSSETEYGGEKRLNTIYMLTIEGINLCFLGALSKKELNAETMEALGDIDILFVPIGGDGVLSAADAYKLAVNLEPKLIIPMHFGAVGAKNALEQFLKEGGVEKDMERLEKLTIKKKDLEGKEGDIMLLKPVN